MLRTIGRNLGTTTIKKTWRGGLTTHYMKRPYQMRMMTKREGNKEGGMKETIKIWREQQQHINKMYYYYNMNGIQAKQTQQGKNPWQQPQQQLLRNYRYTQWWRNDNQQKEIEEEEEKKQQKKSVEETLTPREKRMKMLAEQTKLKWQELKPPTAVETTMAITMKAGQWMVISLPKLIYEITAKMLLGTVSIMKEPQKIVQFSKTAKDVVIKEAKHYGKGFMLLGKDISAASKLMWKVVVRGKTLTYRERKQLTATVADIFRMFPMLLLVVIPAGEALIPVLVKTFPNFIPSQFRSQQTPDMKQTALAKAIEAKKEYATFLTDIVELMTMAKKKNANATELSEFMEFWKKIRNGESVSEDELYANVKLFSDDITLDSIPRAQLSAMCSFLGLTTWGSPTYLRNALRVYIRRVRAEDKFIEAEGVSALSDEELQTACRERGMRALGVPREKLIAQLESWINLSLHKAVPVVWLVLSRALMYSRAAIPDESSIKLTLSTVSDSLVNEIAIENTRCDDLSKLNELKMAQLDHTKQLISEEEKEAAEEEEKKKKETTVEEEKMEQQETQEDANTKLLGELTVEKSDILDTKAEIDEMIVAQESKSASVSQLDDMIVSRVSSKINNILVSAATDAEQLESVVNSHILEEITEKGAKVIINKEGLLLTLEKYMELAKDDTSLVNKLKAVSLIIQAEESPTSESLAQLLVGDEAVLQHQARLAEEERKAIEKEKELHEARYQEEKQQKEAAAKQQEATVETQQTEKKNDVETQEDIKVDPQEDIKEQPTKEDTPNEKRSTQ